MLEAISIQVDIEKWKIDQSFPFRFFPHKLKFDNFRLSWNIIGSGRRSLVNNHRVIQRVMLTTFPVPPIFSSSPKIPAFSKVATQPPATYAKLVITPSYRIWLAQLLSNDMQISLLDDWIIHSACVVKSYSKISFMRWWEQI